MLAVHGRLEKSPVISTYVNRQGRIDTVGISNFELQSAIATFYLKNPEDSEIVPRLYTQMYNGDFSQVAPNVMILKKYIYSRIRPMPFSMDMQSGISQDRKCVVKRQIDDAILGSTINFLQFKWMQTTNFRQLPKQFRKMKPNKVDALLLSGTMDGRTYVSSAIELAKKFKNGRHIIIENAGHDLYMQSPLVSETVLAFFKEKEIGINRMKLEPILFE
ncbi:MAG: alpha/beta hydrolase [Maribacter dokdonensis]|uniref:alpha/beta fold hydrolase n=1 Tax=Maribacter dokdonensis TaxID=320912 RepID=UPI0032968924